MVDMNGVLAPVQQWSTDDKDKAPYQRLQHSIHYPRLIQEPPTQLSDEACQLKMASSTTAAFHKAHSLALVPADHSTTPTMPAIDTARHAAITVQWSGGVLASNGNINDQHQEACLLAVNDGLVDCIPPANAEMLG
ncbi:hypothetical protein PTSG_02824 [Salpingoeca rosetta]|uniref:Uncharacterized protein n=1 Tax=Salpingoeca rosetta (strain ATCC 50818 / BSB-021) TaxID=946362 RepID=F2U3F6_SALR5|nr:uncharacterized protein PTSG_02824 [Salpingoeca rosetta]EGD82150.1 hypothetical protein PTSG_02824 [Salpingoeca rosetta]|eukprot:XP_004996333.1 hypothetical protein PTSG_02824 [Salpingoeca rosetta]